jgi:hypothetical protein
MVFKWTATGTEVRSEEPPVKIGFIPHAGSQQHKFLFTGPAAAPLTANDFEQIALKVRTLNHQVSVSITFNSYDFDTDRWTDPEVEDATAWVNNQGVGPELALEARNTMEQLFHDHLEITYGALADAREELAEEAV